MADNMEPQRNDEVFGVISSLFAQKGYLETSMREIAAELSIKPASLYNYFSSKEEALFKLLRESVDKILKKMEEICRLDVSAEEKLSKLIEYYTYGYSVKKEGPILLLNNMDKLSDEHRQILIKDQKRVINMALEIIEELIEKGRMKPIPPKIALFAFFGMTHYTLKWYNQDGTVEPLELVKYFTEIFTHGILR